MSSMKLNASIASVKTVLFSKTASTSASVRRRLEDRRGRYGRISSLWLGGVVLVVNPDSVWMGPSGMVSSDFSSQILPK